MTVPSPKCRMRLQPEALESKILLAGDGVANIDWQYQGAGGGGALYAPSVSPHDSKHLFIASDMGQIFRTDNGGASWGTVDFRKLQGNLHSQIQFTDDPNTLYAIHSVEGYEISTPVKSLDGGQTWAAISDPTEKEVYALRADPRNAERLILSNFSTLYVSTDGGQSFAESYIARDPWCDSEDVPGCGLHVAGAFFHGDDIYVGTSDGMLVSHDGGESFELEEYPGLSSSAGILSFAGGADSQGDVRLFAATRLLDDLWAGIHPAVDYWSEDCSGDSIYRLDIDDSPEWESVLPCNGVSNAEDPLQFPFFLDMASNQIDTVYFAGGSEDGLPIVFKTSDGGENWESVLQLTANRNVRTGWMGAGGIQPWYWSESILGMDVGLNDSDDIVITDFGFAHRSTDGGVTWDALYVQPADRNPLGQSSRVHAAYHGTGLDNTTSWGVGWTANHDLIVFNSDVGGQIREQSESGYQFRGSLDRNSLYRTVLDARTSRLYAAVADTHDIYQSTHLTDTELDSDDRSGAVLYSDDHGATWRLLHAFEGQVVWVALDPANPNRLYASVVETVSGQPRGGIWRGDSIEHAGESVWRQLPSPPRTEGHPFNIRVLVDGSLVASYSAPQNRGGRWR